MQTTGTQFVTAALRELNVLDPTATAEGEQLEDGLAAGCDLLDTWRTKKLIIGGVTISLYSLSNGVQSYTIGDGATFNQDYPNSIELWSVVPDDDATDPVEIPMGRPVTSDEWQQVRIKSQTGSRPTVLFFDRAYNASGYGHILVAPIPDSNDVDIKLYQTVPEITSLVAGTTYSLRPGVTRALKLNLALEVADRYGKAATVTPRLERRATEALAALKAANIRPKESPIRHEFVIGQNVGRRTFHIYNGS